MYATLNSCSLTGLEGIIVQVEVDITRGLPSFDMVGLPDAAVKEAKERVRAAIKNSGYDLPPKRITINLAPGHKRKAGTHFDLSIAVGILKATGQIKARRNLSQFVMIGELALDGGIRPVEGVLPMAMSVLTENFVGLIVPFTNFNEAQLARDLMVEPVSSLKELILFLEGKENKDNERMKWKISKGNQGAKVESEERLKNESLLDKKENNNLDFNEVQGQIQIKRALEIAAAGNHNILIMGPPGTGKSMLAKRTPGILPDLSFSDCLEVTKIYSVAGLLKKGEGLISNSPVRSPHHGITGPALTGGGRDPVPGEVSLAHKGILLLDELPEFSQKVLEQLRQPLEDKKITISRYNSTITYPADFMLIATMNPCICGKLYLSGEECICTEVEVKKYHKKLSGSLRDRIDLSVEAFPLGFEEIRSTKKTQSSLEIKKRVIAAREIQRQRYKNIIPTNNGSLNHAQVKKFCIIDKEGEKLLARAYESLGLSVRFYDKILKISRTIADLEGCEKIETKYLAEAIQYRALERAIN